MVRIKLAGAAMSAMRDVPVVMVAGPGKACGVALVNADVIRTGVMRGAEAEGGRLAVAGKAALARGAEAEGGRLAVAGKAALARGAEAEGARLVGMTKAMPTGMGAMKASKAIAMTVPAKVVVTKATVAGASLWGSGLSLGLGLGAGALGPLLLVGALGAVGFGIYLGLNQEPH